MEIRNHRLVGVPYKASPNIGGVMTPSYLIQHFTAASGSSVGWLTSKESGVSAHLEIGREGEIVQMVDFNRVAWHAGKSEWHGMVGLNTHSIGIEIVNTGTQEYTEKQMDSVIEVSKLLRNLYDLKEVIGHEDISVMRKSDPSGTNVNLFDWVSLLRGCCFDITPYKNISALNVRRGQGTQYPIVATLPLLTDVYELNRVGEWSKIQVKGSNQAGWVSNKFLK